MTSIINASVSSNGIVSTADASGILKVQSNGSTTNALAWVRFTGSNGSVLSSFNVSSVTRGGVGTYAINFTTAMVDANYVGVGLGSTSVGTGGASAGTPYYMVNTYSPVTNTVVLPTTTSYAFGANTGADPFFVAMAVFGN